MLPSTPLCSAKAKMSYSKIGWKYSSANAILFGILGLMAVMTLLLYLSVLMSPALFRKIVQDAANSSSSTHQSVSGSFPPSRSNEHTGNGVKNNSRSSSSGLVKASFKILVGIFTTASRLERRTILRLAYAKQFSSDADIVVRFVIGSIGSEFEDGRDLKMYQTLVGMENVLYGDLMVLSCRENLNSGKTYSFFSNVPTLGIQYDYVMKLDDDSYIRFDNLASSIKPLSRTDLYFGYVLPCESDNPYENYMGGMGYVISWDLVEWIQESPITKNNTVGTEDVLIGQWFKDGGKAKNRVTKKPQFYDHVEFGGACAHDFTPDTILVHQLKNTKRWADALSYFEKDRIADQLSGFLFSQSPS